MRIVGLLFFFLLVILLEVSAQGEVNNWFFGDSTAVSFNSGPPVPISGSGMFSSEGCATISDAQGNLLFYTNGENVWDATHTVMPNGSGLLGNESSAQAAVIVPRPSSNTDYYVFTSEGFAGPVTYSKVDMTLNSGLGDIDTTEKNIVLATGTTEKLMAVRHQNNTDVWVMIHMANNDEFRGFLVTAMGVNPMPAVSNMGSNYIPAINSVGCMKASPNGAYIASARFFSDTIELFDFDNTTGIVTNLIASFTANANSIYGLEFSPNSQLLYSTGLSNPEVWQWDISSGDQTTIINSGNQVGTMATFTRSLQMGPDCRIYVISGTVYGMSVIKNPNAYGPACNYLDSAVIGINGMVGLPNFISNYFLPAFDYTNICFGDTTFFETDTSNVDSLHWNFDDPNSGVNNTSNQLFPFHVFSDSGDFRVRLISFSGPNIDTAYCMVSIVPIPQVDLGNDTALCALDTILLNASFPGVSFLWNDSSTSGSLLADSIGTFWVTLENICGVASDTIQISLDTAFTMTLGQDTLLCGVNTYTINPQFSGSQTASFLWQDGSTDTTLTISQSDTIVLTVSNNCTSVTDSIIVDLLSIPSAQLPGDTILCTDTSFTISHANAPNITYLWSDSTSADTLLVDSPGIYWLMASNACGNETDSLQVVIQPPIQIELGPDTTICQEDSLLLNATVPNATYLWSDGSTTPSLIVKESGTYSVMVNVSECTQSDSIRIGGVQCKDTIDCIVVVPNVFTPNGDGRNDLLLVNTTCSFGNFTLSIFNRWGQKVYETNHENIGWDGTVSGIPAEQGVYFWIIDFQDDVVVDVDRKGKTGSLTLIR